VSEQGRAFERVRESFAKQGLMGAPGGAGEQGRRGLVCDRDTLWREAHPTTALLPRRCRRRDRRQRRRIRGVDLRPGGREVLTVEYKINFLAPAWGREMVAEGRS
jgi:hypothetical protein